MNVWQVDLVGNLGQLQAAIVRRCPQVLALALSDDGDLYRLMFRSSATCEEILAKLKDIPASQPGQQLTPIRSHPLFVEESRP